MSIAEQGFFIVYMGGSMRPALLIIIIAVLSACTSITSRPTYHTDDGAIEGYDTVAYFTVQKPVKGEAQFNYQHNGATWFFASRENQKLFENNPQDYAPQYGGYCAYAMSNNFVVSSDPNAFSLVEGKLYLNYSLGVRDTWSKSIPRHIKSADKNWLEKTAADTATY